MEPKVETVSTYADVNAAGHIDFGIELFKISELGNQLDSPASNLKESIP